MAKMTFKTDLVPNSDYGYSLGSIENTSNPLRWKINGSINGAKIFYGTCAEAAAVKTCVCPEFTASDLVKGTIIYVTMAATNTGAVASLTLNVNGTGAKPIKYMYNSAVNNIPDKGYILANQTYIMHYDGTNWVIDNIHYNTDNNTTAYQVRYTGGTYAPTTVLYRYMLLLSKNETQLIPMNTTSNSTATTKTTITTDTFNPFLPIYYYSTTTTVNANAAIPVANLWVQMVVDLRYSFNTGTTLTNNKDVYIVATPITPTTAQLAASPISQTLPSTEDGYIYIRLGHASSTSNITLTLDHPIFWYKNGKIRPYTGGRDIAGISRNGTTFTVTRDDGTTFTFDQQDSNTWTQLSTSSGGYVGTKLPGNTTTFLCGDGSWSTPAYPVTQVAGKTGSVTLGTLTVGSKTYNGSGDTTIEIADLGLASTTTFLGITSTNLSNESTTSPVNIVIGPTTGNVSPSNGSVVMEQDSGEEYIWTGNKWNLMGLASSWALANHIHGNILNNGTITSDTTKASGQHLVITDSNNKVSRSNITLGTNTSKYLRNDGSWEVPASDHKVTQVAAITTAGAYPIILATSTVTTEQTNTVNKTSTLTYNPSTTKLHTPILEVTTASYGETLPSSGTTGQLFFQTSSGGMYELPTGGTVGQVLVKNSANDRDVTWGNPANTTTAVNATNAYTSASTAKAYIVGATTNAASFKALVHNASVYTENTVLFGAAWNDYAEFRKDNQNEIQEPGRCVAEQGDGALALTTQRLQRGCEIISDTFGFAIGQDEENGYNTPIAVSGRVLAYIYEGREAAIKHIGWPVCSGPDGTVSIMTEEEEEKYPSRIIGTISEIPNYEYWGAKSIAVKERVWVRIK